jgi:hypothetical protein
MISLKVVFPLFLILIDVQADADTNKSLEWTNVELIPRDQLCLLCHAVIKKFQDENNKNPEEFKNVSFFQILFKYVTEFANFVRVT